jgi:6-phosphofructokinase 2
MTDFTKISGESRTNVIIKEEATGRQFVISAVGPEIAAVEIGHFYQHLLKMNAVTYLVLSGSLPRGVSHNIYAQLILAGRNKKSFVLLDTDGTALKKSIDYQPTGIKPNRYELSRLAGQELDTKAEILTACDAIHRKGISYILVSRGKDGLILSTDKQKTKATLPPVKVDSTVGAGDSVVGGFVLAHSRGEEMKECLRLACAAGTATAQTPGTELCHRADVENLFPRVEIADLE